MAKRKLAPDSDAADAPLPASAPRLPAMSAESALGPPSRQYRSPMASAFSGAEGVVPSQMGDEGDMDNDADEGTELTTDEDDEISGDAGDDDGEAEGDGSDDEQAAAGA